MEGAGQVGGQTNTNTKANTMTNINSVFYRAYDDILNEGKGNTSMILSAKGIQRGLIKGSL